MDDLAVAGTPEKAQERIESFAAIDGLDSVAISFPRDASQAEIETTVREFAPE